MIVMVDAVLQLCRGIPSPPLSGLKSFFYGYIIEAIHCFSAAQSFPTHVALAHPLYPVLEKGTHSVLAQRGRRVKKTLVYSSSPSFRDTRVCRADVSACRGGLLQSIDVAMQTCAAASVDCHVLEALSPSSVFRWELFGNVCEA